MAAQATNDAQNAIPIGFQLPGPPTATVDNARSVTGFAIYPGLVSVGGVWVNRVFDNVAGKHVIWESVGAADIALGVQYPGPGTFDPTEGGNDTESHVVQAILEE